MCVAKNGRIQLGVRASTLYKSAPLPQNASKFSIPEKIYGKIVVFVYDNINSYTYMT